MNAECAETQRKGDLRAQFGGYFREIDFIPENILEMTRDELNDLAYEVIGAAIEVHKEMGPDLLESVYEHCLVGELRRKNIEARTQVSLPIYYKGEKLDKHYIVDILVENEIIIELKCVEEVHPIHEVQLVTYMKLAKKRLGYLMNFNVRQMTDGIKRKVNKF